MNAITPSQLLISVRQLVFYFSSQGSFTDMSVRSKGALCWYFAW
jgi:hypothetical protein